MFAAAALAAAVLTGPFGMDLSKLPEGCTELPDGDGYGCPPPDPRITTFMVNTAETGRICYLGGKVRDDAGMEVLQILVENYGRYTEHWSWTPDPKFGLLHVAFTDLTFISYMIDHPDCTEWRKKEMERIRAEEAKRPRRF